MKLSARYNRVNLATSIVILLLSGIVYYVVIHFILTERLDKDLEIEENEISEYVETYNKLPLPGDFKDQRVEYSLLADSVHPARQFMNTVYKNESENEIEPGRSLITTLTVRGERFKITITKSRVQSEDLVQIIFLITLGITSILLISLFLTNRLLLSRLWKPFYTALDQMKAFNLADKNGIESEQTSIDEFNELNTAATSLALRVKKDYKDLKSFTDNASHEMMTPLAVINSKLDTLLQNEPLSDSQGELINDIYDAVGRLSRLNHSLLLLAKIENNLISEQNEVDLKELIEQKIRQFNELIHANSIVVKSDLNIRVLAMSKYLADILLNNLISNAIRHNHAGGEIRIILSAESLEISNTGGLEVLNKDQVFERFNKRASSEGMGLGLAISRQICNLYGFSIDYKHVGDNHTFTILF
jgi:signal transduction histidine kinase